MWQDRLLHCVVFTKTSEEFAPHYLAGIRHDLRQTTDHVVTEGKFLNSPRPSCHPYGITKSGQEPVNCDNQQPAIASRSIGRSASTICCSIVFILLTDSTYSRSAIDSATMPAPAFRQTS